MESSLYVQSIFNCLKQFKKLPTYQFERRIDAFLLPYLEKAFNDKFKIFATDFTVFVYPEFPLWPKKKNEFALDKSAKRSVYADYLMYSKSSNILFLVEMKTDANSVNQEQIDTYVLNCLQGWDVLFTDLF